MPTAILLSIASSFSKFDPEKLQCRLQKGLAHFIRQILQNNPFEYICIASSSQDICPFTRDLETLISSLSQVTESANDGFTMPASERLHNGIKRLNEIINQRWGRVIAPFVVQLVIIVDVYPNDLWTTEPINIEEFPLPTKIHVIAFGPKFDTYILESKRQQLNIETLERLSSNTGGHFGLFRPDDHTRFLKEKFNDIVEREYKIYKGKLTLGHLVTDITLHPNPNGFCWQHITLIYRENSLPTQFPQLLSVLGFIPVSLLGSAPEICRFTVLPFEVLLFSSSLSTGATSCVKDPLCIMLHEVLKTHQLAAVAQLEPNTNWYGVLFVVSENITVVETVQKKKRKRRKSLQTSTEKASNVPTLPSNAAPESTISIPSDQSAPSSVTTEDSLERDPKPTSTEDTQNISSEIESGTVACLNNNNSNNNNNAVEGLIEEFSQEKEIERHGLVLSVFPKGSYIEWLGDMEHLAILPLASSLSDSSKEKCDLPSELENELPLKGKKKQSYDTFAKTSYKVPSISEDSLQAHFQKIAKVLKSLPQKTTALFNECEKLRKKAITFALPGLIDALIDFLQFSMESFEQGSKAEPVVAELIKQLKARNTPLSFDEKEKTQRPLKMSVTNLIT
jgi:hypothetical protein